MSAQEHPEPDYVIVADPDDAPRSLAEIKAQLARGAQRGDDVVVVFPKSRAARIIGSLGDIMGESYQSTIREIVSPSTNEALVADWQRIGGDLRRALSRVMPEEERADR